MNAFLRPMNAPSCPDDVSTLQYRNSAPSPPSAWRVSPPMAGASFPQPFHLCTPPARLPFTWAQYTLYLFCPEGSFSQKSKNLSLFFTFSSSEVICPPTELFLVWSLSVTTQEVPPGRAVSWPSLCYAPIESIAWNSLLINDSWVTNRKNKSFLHVELLFNTCLPTALLAPFGR